MPQWLRVQLHLSTLTHLVVPSPGSKNRFSLASTQPEQVCIWMCFFPGQSEHSEWLLYHLVLSWKCTWHFQSVTAVATRLHSSPAMVGMYYSDSEQRSLNTSPEPNKPSLSGSRSLRPRSWSSSPLSRAQAGPGCCGTSQSRPGSERSGLPEGCTTCTHTADGVCAWGQNRGKQTGSY